VLSNVFILLQVESYSMCTSNAVKLNNELTGEAVQTIRHT